MYNEGFEQWLKTNKNFMNPINDWNKVTTEMCRKITQQNLEIFGDRVTRFSDQLKRLSSVKKPEDFLNLQKDYLNEEMTAGIECMQKCIRTTLENMEEMSKLYGTFRDTVTSTAVKATEKVKEKEKETR